MTGKEWSAELTVLRDELLARFPGVDILKESALYSLDGMACAGRQLARLEAASPPTIVEIGTDKGVTAIALARIAPLVITVDVAQNPLRAEVWRSQGVTNVLSLVVPDNEHKHRLAQYLSQVGIVFVDGDHSRDGCAFDFALAQMITDAVLFHDYHEAYAEGPRAVVDALEVAHVIKDRPFAWWFRDAAAKAAMELVE